jgi:hypothetical protein
VGCTTRLALTDGSATYTDPLTIGAPYAAPYALVPYALDAYAWFVESSGGDTGAYTYAWPA